MKYSRKKNDLHFITLGTAALTCTLLWVDMAQAQWVSFSNQTGSRIVVNLPDVPGDAIQVNNDAQEKDYCWGDVDNDGDIDLICVRKIPLSHAGGKRNILFMNENGVLVDRTQQLAVDASGVPAAQGVSQGFLDPTNDRQAVLVDVNNDGWLDLVTATTIADVNDCGNGSPFPCTGSPNMLPWYIGHPRVYINKGEVSGVWQGFRYEYPRFPQIYSKTNVPTNPRFCSVAAGDINNDGYVDLYFVDYDSGEVGPAEPPENDTDNKLMVNQGASNPGYFVDQSIMRMGANYNYTTGTNNLLYSTFGAHGLICDMNGDGVKDVVKITTLDAPIHTAVITNPGSGIFTGSNNGYKVVENTSPYNVSAADLNGDGRLDLVVTTDGTDRYLLNSGNAVDNSPNFTISTFGAESEFGSQSTIADLNNDGWPDVIIADVDLDTIGCSRRSHIYHNRGNAPNVTIIEEAAPTPIPNSSLIGCYNFAIFDINGDGWKDIVIGKCNSTEVWMNNGLASLAFTYPNGRPTTLAPNAATNFQVQITGTYGGAPMTNSGKLYYSVNGAAFVQTSMTSLGGNLYQATIPATPCGGNVRYYVTGQITTGGTFTDPPANTYNNATPASYFSAYAGTGTQNLINENFEGAAAGWTVNNISVTGGAWEVATPIGTWNEGIKAAPSQNNTSGGSKCFVTGNGLPGGAPHDADVDGGPTQLLSPVFDLTGTNGVVSFARWFYTSTPADVLNVAVSNNNGSSWVTVANYTSPVQPNFSGHSTITQTKWIATSFVVGDYVTPTNQVRVRFSVQDAAPAGIVEAAIDDFRVDKITCQAPCPADINGNGFVNIDDLFAVINSWGPCAGCPADVNGNGFVNIDDLFAVINSWGQCP